jgi:hypothetical protein
MSVKPKKLRSWALFTITASAFRNLSVHPEDFQASGQISFDSWLEFDFIIDENK